MSANYPHSNPVLHGMRRMEKKLEATDAGMADFMQRDKMGEKPDPAEFMKILEQRMIAKQAIQAQFKLHEKPIKTVLNETK